MQIIQCHCHEEEKYTRTTYAVHNDGTHSCAMQIADWIRSYRPEAGIKLYMDDDRDTDNYIVRFEDEESEFIVGKEDYLLYTPNGLFLDCDAEFFKNNFEVQL